MISRLAGFVCFLSVLSKLYAQQTINYACPSGWENIGTSCYRVFGTSSSQALTWQNAYRTCQGYGSMLVEVHDYLSNEEIGMFGYQRSASKFWIGMSRINANNDAFSTTWNMRTPATIYEGYYHNNMPDLTKGDCMYVERSNDYPTYKWVVGKCKEKMAFICQRPSCPTGSFFCNNGRCINSQWFCDGEDNCGDFSDENSCSSRCRQEFTMSSGTILSPNYPQPYDSAKVCTWTIITPEGTNVFLQFNSFNTEENNDIVDILIGGRTETTSRSIARISGSSPSMSRFRSYNNYMIVRLQSDQQTQYSGFNATFTSLNDNYPEATYLTAISTPQNLEPPLFQSTGANSYLGNKDYVWVLTAQERRKIITIERLMIDLAMGDEIDIHDGDSPSAPIIARYRAHNNDNVMWTMHTTQSPHGPRFVFSTDYKMYIIMRTASSTSGRGFRFNYWQGCDVTYTQEYGEIFSPGYSVVNYANNQECTWTIDIASGKAFSLQFDAGFQLQDNYDFLQVFKAATNSSGVPAHPVTNGFTTVSLASSNPIKSDNGKMFLRFKTGAVTNAKGFRALYSVDCPNPSFSAYTSKSSATSNSYLVNFEVSCLSGYSFRTDEFMSARVRMECMLGGNWLSANKTRTIPSCLPNYCGLPSTVANAYISASSGVEYNNYATYTCYQGYRLIGNANVTCLASGQWSIGPTCQAASCPQAGDIVNGQRTVKSGDLTSYASIVQYNCNEGFELVGVPILFCQSNGTWTSVLPTCRPLKCPLPMVMHGSLSQNTMPDVGQSVTVSCDTGYQIVGNAAMNCLANETFDAVPMCNDIDECQPLAGCAQRCHNTEGSYTCSCNDGYTLNSDGRNCDDINECNIDNGGCDQVCTNTVGTYTCTCNEAGYILFSQDGTSGYNIQTNVETGLRVNDTLHLNHTCVRVSCPTPVTVADASLMSQRTTHRYQDTISYFCNLGYVRTSGSEDFTCGSDGQWSPSQTSNILVCSGATCPAENWQSQSLVNSPQSVVPNTAVNYLDYVNITCNVQGRGTFVKQRQCLYDKPTNSYKLYGDEYECGVIDCGSPGQEPNTNYPLPAQTTYGSTFTYTCAALMALSGNSSLGNSLVTCMANGNWDFGSLQCLGSSCPDPGYPNGGYQVANSYAKNSIVTFGCNRTGYELTFTEGLECIVNQAGNGLEWNNTNRPQCVDTQNPSVSNCESDRSVIPFSRVALSTPFVSDNTGIKTESYSPVSANTTLTVEKTPVTVTYTVQDFENLAHSCTTTFSVTDNVPPTVTCPDSRVEYVSGSGTKDITTVTPANVVASDTTPGGAGTRPTVVVSPPNIVVSTGNIDQFFNVQVQATDAAGLQDTCSFQILIRADPCSEISLPTPANGLKNCSATNNGHVCDLGCLNGFVSYNNPNQDVVTVTCTTGNPWPTVIPACTPLSVQAEYQQVYTVSYSSPNNQILNQACLATYEAQMRIDIPTDEVTAVNTCRPSTGATLVDILQNEVQATFISNSQIDIRFTIKFQPPSSAEGCGNLMETLVSARTLSLMSLTTNNCTEITGSWSNNQNQLQEGSICSSNRKEATIDNVKWCLDCPLGMYSTGSAQCSLCPKGTYKSVVGQQECTPCNAGLSTHDEGSISSNACKSQCSSGTYSKDLATGLPPCFQCAKNSYGFNSTTCQSCDPDTITLNTGSFSSTSCLAQCQPGTFSHNGHIPCTSCPANYFQSQAGKTGCQKCASNSRSTAGSSSCTVINGTAECTGRCQNGAQCVVQDHQVQCLCTAGYYGSQCNIQVDNCLSRPCYNGGICVNGVNSYTCNCPTGLTGSQCEVDMVNECDSAPCKNGGMCVNQIGSFKCLCIAGFSGITCESQQNICVQQPCSNGARCVSLDNVRRRCECLDGYEGVSCQTNINECSSNPCLYGGSCVDLVNGYRCDCAEGYGGSRCETRVNPCSLGRCQNGQCVDDYTLDNFRCVCNPGYAYGRICQYEITMAMGISGANPFQTPSANNASECRSHCERNTFCAHFTYNATSMLCRLYGTSSSLNRIQETGTDMYTRKCIDPDDDYFTPWYSVDMPNGGDDTERRSDLINLGLNVCNGTRPVAAECRKKGSEMMSSQTGDSFSLACSIDGLVCQHLNNNPCEDYEVRYKCPVADVFEGSTCSQKQYCTDSTCQRGTCNNIFGGFTCTCPLGYSGSKCQHNFDDCTVTPCQNGATCRDGFGQAFCDCLPGFGGPLCQNNLNDCGNCTPGNTLDCNDHINDFTCNCQPGFTGKNCSEDIDECASNPCLHGGSCDNLRNGFRCNCMDGWTGDRCQDIVSQCQVNSCVQDATCQNLFNKFYCNCANNTYGERCENSPNICQDVGPCLNGATCSGSRSEAITCACPNNNYHGDGCETMVDHCAAGDKCKNGGTCTNNVPGFTCSCPNGYTGTTCETNINDCVGVTCPGAGSTCIDMINQRYCRCALGKTGDACNRDVDTNYDMYFYLPQRNGYASLPYPIKLMGSAWSVSMWVRFYESSMTGTFFTMFTTPSANSLAGTQKFFSLDNQGLKIFHPTASQRSINHETITVNDGRWHYVVVTWNKDDGFDLILDSVRQGQLRDFTEYMGSDLDLNIWISLGAEYGSNMMIVESRGFRGYLSQLNVYNRQLDFVNEIPLIYDTPRRTFSGLILVWNEFIYHLGVQPIYPSYASKDGCAGNIAGNICNQNQDKAAPVYRNCPSDIFILNRDRLTTVTWPSPVVEGASSEKKRFNSGETFPHGKFINTYEARDASNNAAFCSFTIYVMSDNCTEPDNPYLGTQTCERGNYPHIGCTIGCQDSTRQIDRETPNIYTCGPTGSWYPLQRNRKLRYPACGLTAGPATKRIKITLLYPKVTTANCGGINDTLQIKVREAILTIRNTWSSVTCRQPNCADVIIVINCQASNTGRRKRQASVTSVDITIPEADATWRRNNPTEELTAEEAITRHVLEEGLFDFSLVIPNAELDPNGFELESTSICPEPQTALNGYCVFCGAGNFYNSVTKICEDCAIGSYQSLDNQTSCVSCDPDKTTETTGTFTSAGCKTSCPVGSYFDNTLNRCELCAVGYYQSMTGQFYCDPCPAGKTTRDPGSNSSAACNDDCPSGQELTPTGSCQPCPVGTYRTQGAQTVCESCPSNLTTPSTGSKTINNCSLISCLAGNYRSGDSPGTCVPCPIGTYQDQKWQTSCNNCSSSQPDRYRTDQTGSVSVNQCKFFCPSGYGDIGNSCEICAIGFYKNNTRNYYGPCVPCPGNRRTPSRGSTSESECTIYRCPPGYKPNATSDGCDPCPYGTFQSLPDQENCVSCNGGFSTREIAATTSSQCQKFCEDGQEVDSFGTCINCTVGYYKTNTDFKFNNCTMCPTNYVTPSIKSISVNNCTVRACLAGSRRNGDDSGCIGCERGTYQEMPYKQTCSSCGNQQSTRQANSTQASDCEAYCLSGEEKASGGQCTVCPVGYFKDNNVDVFSMCTVCPDARFITANNGSTSQSDCTVANCSAGYYRDTNTNTCKVCAKGTYQPDKWQTSCVQCPTDKTTSGTGATDSADCQLECPPGKEDINGTCEPCPKGYYKVQAAAARCDECPVNTTTSGTGSIQQSDCSVAGCQPGYFLNASLNNCFRCPYDTYQPMKWQTTCDSCQNNYVTLYTGSVANSDCVVECSSGSEYDTVTGNCKLCQRGYYRDQAMRTEITCQLCPLDKITPGTGGTSSSDCSQANCTQPGYYRNPITNTCTLCPDGTYNSDKWQDSCASCGSGFTTNGTGKMVQSDCIRDCPSGSFPDGSNTCRNCARGFYRDRADGLFPCRPCPSGYTTVGEGATSSANCSITACGIGERFVNGACVPCQKNYYQNLANQRDCIPCGFGKYTDNEGSTSIAQCKTFCVDTNICHTNAACTATADNMTCTCNTDWRGDGYNCTHLCDLGYCVRGSCRKSPLSCSCPDGYTGDRCEAAVDRSAQSSRLNETIVIASVSAAAFLMLIIIIIVCCVAMARRSKKAKPPMAYNDMGPIVEKPVFAPTGYSLYDNRSMRSMSPSRVGTMNRHGMSQVPELTFDNQAYQGARSDRFYQHYQLPGRHIDYEEDDPAIYTA